MVAASLRLRFKRGSPAPNRCCCACCRDWRIQVTAPLMVATSLVRHCNFSSAVCHRSIPTWSSNLWCQFWETPGWSHHSHHWQHFNKPCIIKTKRSTFSPCMPCLKWSELRLVGILDILVDFFVHGFRFQHYAKHAVFGTVDFCCLGRAKEHHDERGKPIAGPASCSWFGWYGLGAMSFFYNEYQRI